MTVMIAGVRGRTSWLLGLLVALRLAYLGQYLQLPFLFGPVFDSQVYLAQADAIAARRFDDPTLLAFSPLYGYFLALFGNGPARLLPILLQLALGILNVVMIHRITMALWKQASAALWASAVFALYGPLMFFESKIMSETLGLSLLLLGIDRLVSLNFAFARLHAVAACGACLALAVLARASLLFTLPFFVVSAVFLQPANGSTCGDRTIMRGDGLRRGIGLALVLALIFATYGEFNRRQSGLFVPLILTSNTASQAAQGEWRGDLSAFQGPNGQQVGAWSVVEQARTRLAAIQAGLPDPALARQGTFGDLVTGWLRQLPSKLSATFRDLETTFDYGYYGERSEVSVLYFAWISFGLLLSLAVLGAIAVIRAGNWRSLVPLLPVVLGVIATTTMFHPSTRYRLPLAVALAPLAGLAVSEAIRLHRQGRSAMLRGVGLIALAFAVRSVTRPVSHPGLWELRVAESAVMAGDLPECRKRVATALQVEARSEQVRSRADYVLSINPACAAPDSGPK